MLLNCGAWRRLLRVNLDRKEINPVSPKGNQSWILEGLILKLKLQYFGHRMRRADSLEKPLMLGKIEGRRTRGQQRMRWLDDITVAMDMSLISSRSWWWTGKPGVLQSMGSQRVGHDWVTELNWLSYSHLVASVLGNFIARPFDYLFNNGYKFPAGWETRETDQSFIFVFLFIYLWAHVYSAFCGHWEEG